MTTKYAQHFSTRATPQSEPVYGKGMVQNAAGGHVFGVDCWKRLERFLILGCEGGSYYASERQMTRENAVSVLECADIDIKRTVQMIADISVSGRAPKNDPAVFALGLLSSRWSALDAVNSVCRTGTHLFQFVETAKNHRGWGRSLKRAVQNWYLSKSPRDLSYQLVKYQSRNGFSHRDVLRLCKPSGVKGVTNLALRWAVGKASGDDLSELPPIHAFELAKRATSAKDIVRLIKEYDLVRECIPTQFLDDASVWKALLDSMPLTALIRNLGKMTSVGLLGPLNDARVCCRLRDSDLLSKSRVHPMAILLAQSVYAHGRGIKGKLTWAPSSQVLDALNDAFHLSFHAVVPTKQRWLLALDVSGSMGGSCIAGTHLSAMQAAAAVSLVTASVEPNYAIIGFTGRESFGSRKRRGVRSGVEPLAISPRQRLDDVVRYMTDLPMGMTDCALPMLYAMDHSIPVDVFAIYTDNETWCGDIHPFQALQMYRQKSGIAAKLVVVGMTSSGFTIADPTDRGMLDVVGFDAAAPAVIADFARS